MVKGDGDSVTPKHYEFGCLYAACLTLVWQQLRWSLSWEVCSYSRSTSNFAPSGPFVVDDDQLRELCGSRGMESQPQPLSWEDSRACCRQLVRRVYSLPVIPPAFLLSPLPFTTNDSFWPSFRKEDL